VGAGDRNSLDHQSLAAPGGVGRIGDCSKVGNVLDLRSIRIEAVSPLLELSRGGFDLFVSVLHVITSSAEESVELRPQRHGVNHHRVVAVKTEHADLLASWLGDPQHRQHTLSFGSASLRSAELAVRCVLPFGLAGVYSRTSWLSCGKTCGTGVDAAVPCAKHGRGWWHASA
jgi:hypothetical protein